MFVYHPRYRCAQTRISGGDITTMVVGKNTKTGEIVVGTKMRGMGKDFCAEDIVVDKLGGIKEDVVFSQAFNPRTEEFIPVCSTCQTKFTSEQFVPGTKFK